ncbi:hypothetical protein GCM10009816_02180 [Microbacterium aquimaris]
MNAKANRNHQITSKKFSQKPILCRPFGVLLECEVYAVEQIDGAQEECDPHRRMIPLPGKTMGNVSPRGDTRARGEALADGFWRDRLRAPDGPCPPRRRAVIAAADAPVRWACGADRAPVDG